MSSNGTRGLAFPAHFELLPWGTFPVSTQRTSCHFMTRRFTDLRISKHHRVSPVYFELTILGNFSVYQLAYRIKRDRSLPRYLCLSPGHFSVSVSAPVLAKGTNGVTIFPVFSGLSRLQYLRISNVRHWGNLKYLDLWACLTIGLSVFPRSTSRVLSSDCLAVDGREGPSPLYPRKAAPARPRERLSLRSAQNTGTFDFTRTGTKRH